MVRFPCFQDGLAEALAAHRVRIELCFQANRAALIIHCAALSCPGAKEVGRIELDAGHGGKRFHRNTALWARQNGRFIQLSRIRQAEIVIVPAAVLKLLIVRADIPSNRLSRAEVKGRPVYRQNFARRHALITVLQKLLCVDLQHMRKSRTAAVQIKIAVVREVAERVPVALCVIHNHQRTVFYAVGHADRERSGVALFHIG